MTTIHTNYRFASRVAATIGLLTGFTPSVSREDNGWGAVNVPDNISPHLDFIASQIDAGEKTRTIVRLVRVRLQEAGS